MKMNLDNPITRILVLCACVSRASHHYNFPIEVQLWDARRTPLDQMVDVTNQFGLKVLYEHNFLNQNNVAFSPYGLTGILMALFEGVEGESSYQIQRCMELPWNRDALRIGFRDIHRTLKTYFIPEEGFLAGLALNNENVTFKEEYRNILRFYGFDLETDRLPKQPPTTTSPSTPTILESTTNSNKEETTSSPPQRETSSMEPRQPSAEATTVSSLIQTTMSSTQATTAIASGTAADTVASFPNDSTTVAVVPSTNSLVETSAPIAETTSGIPSVTTVEETGSAAPEETTVAIMTTPTTSGETGLPSTVLTVTETSTSPAAMETTSAPPTSSAVNVGEISPEAPSAMPTINYVSTNADTAISQVTLTTARLPTNTPDTITVTIATSTTTSAADTDPPTVPETDTMTTINSEVELLTTSSAMSMVTTTASNGTPSPSTAVTSVSTTATSGTTASPTSPAEAPATTNAEPVTTISPGSPTPSPSPMTVETATAGLETLERRKRSILNFIMERPSGYEEYLNAPLEFESGIHPKYSSQTMFLANGLKNVEVSYMVYDTVLEYTYLPHFKASAIKLPLDNDHYYLLVVLPDYEFDLNRLTKRLALESNLRDIYSALQPRYVQACVPSFMVKGFVTLTPDLQRLGIRDVFEPRQNDFSPMTTQKGVYVRNVEQSITVTIRKYQNETSQKSRYVLNRHPVYFSATYPFLYFVMDSNIHVSLMAGKLMDPLNTRVI